VNFELQLARRVVCSCYTYRNSSSVINETYHFIQGFLDVDSAMLQEESLKNDLAGTTAVAIILKDNRLYCVCTVVKFCMYLCLVS
jgi:serine/threonine protein phosphatase PrpC